jgi:8-oxo-dGTP pyrophosphatase MutT (NUDIX family)
VSGARIIQIERLDLTFEPKAWSYADTRRAEIDAHFAGLQAANPALWNGRVLLMDHYSISNGILSGTFIESDYASFVAWQDWGRPVAGIYDCFAAAAIATADGAYLVGVMAEHTYNAGDIYFPCGTLDMEDIVNGKVDFEASVLRELKEETGLGASDVALDPDWVFVSDNELIAAIKVMRSPLAAEPLRALILETLARQRQPELADILIVRSASDFDPNMRGFVRAFLARRFGDK